MKRIVGSCFWVLRSVMLVTALVVLILWPSSYRRGASVWHRQRALGAAGIENHGLYAACWGGRVGIASWRWEKPRRLLKQGLEEMDAHGSGGQWRFLYSEPGSFGNDTGDTWFPIWLGSNDSTVFGSRITVKSVSVPCWFFCLSTAAWPTASVVLLTRRRVRRLGFLRAGRCTHCGYDLRATPEPGGELLARCPECATPFSRAF